MGNYKLVPVEPTKEMLSAMEEMYMPLGEMIAAYDGAIMSSPDPTTDDALVRTIASILDHPSVFMGGPSQQNMKKARAAIAALEGRE